MSAAIDPVLLRAIRDLIDVLPGAAFVKDRNSVFIATNNGFIDRLGLGGDFQIAGKTEYDICEAEDAKLFIAGDREVMDSGVPMFEMLETQVRADGTAGVYNTTKVPIHDAVGRVVGLVGFTMEVVDPDRVATQLVISEQRYALAMRASRDGIWDFDLSMNAAYMSPRCCQLLDLGVSTDAVPLREVVDRIGRSEMRSLLKSIRPLVRERVESVTHTVQLQLADGSIRWLEIVGTALRVGGRVQRLVGSLADVTEERDRQRALNFHATRDDLTGLSNRRVLVEQIDNLIAGEQRFSLLFLDLDQFKVINDSLGHHAGDRMLLAIATRLDELKKPEHLLARFGGDEFAVLIASDNPKQAEDEANRIVDALRQPVELDGLDVYSTVSVGLVHRTRRHESASDVLRDADIALYRAKDAGKACVRVFSGDMRVDADRELELQLRLRKAVAEKEFQLHYQPIFDAASHELCGVEALLRWFPPNESAEAPGSFLPYLERSGLIAELGEWILDEACRQLREWRVSYPAAADVHLAVNLSRVQFRSDRLVRSVGEAIRSHGLDPNDLILEVTETAVSEDSDHIRDKLMTLRELGFRIAIDDFGIGQSSLSVLYDLPADFVKIDRSFIERIRPGTSEPVIDAVLSIAAPLGLSCIAEGVETELQRNWLREHGCDLLQGFLLARPMPASEIPSFFATGLEAAA